MITRLMAVPVSAVLLLAVGAPVTSAKLTRQDMGDAFILAMKDNDIQTAATYVDAIGPGGKEAVLERPDHVYDGKSLWDMVKGAECHGLVCQADPFPATPAPGWYVLKRNGEYRVVARAYLDTADYLMNEGNFGYLTKQRKVRNRATDWNLVKKVPKGTPVWWVPETAYVNVVVDAGSKVPGKKMIYGYIPHVGKYVASDSSD